MATAVEQALVEITGRVAEFAPQHEGLRDFQRLNLKEETQVEIATFIALYDQRLAVLLAAKAALEALMGDGHPELPVREISPEALADLKENASTIESALLRFGSNKAVSMQFSAAPPEPR